MSEYLPIYQSAISISHSSPAMEVSYGNQTLELATLQNTELLRVDLGTPVLNECSLDDFMIFWFTFGATWFHFHLPEMKLDAFSNNKTAKYAYFESQGLNIYKLFLSVNGISKRIYLPKNLEIVGYTGVVRQLADYTFYLSQLPAGLQIKGLYDVPVIFGNNSVTIDTGKETRLTNIRIEEILFGDPITPPNSLPDTSINTSSTLAVPIVVSPPTSTYSWSKLVTINNPNFTYTNATPQTSTYLDISMVCNNIPDPDDLDEDDFEAYVLTTYTYVQTSVFNSLTDNFEVDLVIEKIYTVIGSNYDPSVFRTQYYRCVKQNNNYFFDISNVQYGKLSTDPAPGPYTFNLKSTNVANWRMLQLGVGVGASSGFNPNLPYEKGWGLKSWYRANGVLKVDATKTKLV